MGETEAGMDKDLIMEEDPVQKKTQFAQAQRKRNFLYTLFYIIITAIGLFVLFSVVIVTQIFKVKVAQSGPTDPIPEVQPMFYNASVASDSPFCSTMGTAILRQGGNAIDAAVTTALCLGVTRPFASGIGGGGFMLVHMNKQESAKMGEPKQVFFDFRERAPAAAFQDMYVNNYDASLYGATAGGTPGEVKGLYEAWERYGRLPWKDLVQPVAKLAKDGFEVEEILQMRLTNAKPRILKTPSLKSFINPATGDIYKHGEIIKREALGNTLEAIANQGSSALYDCNNSQICKNFVRDVQQNGGYISEEDMNKYQVRIRDVVKTTMQFPSPGGGEELEMIFGTLPSSGVIVQFALQVFSLSKARLLKGTSLTAQEEKVMDMHLVIEALKFAFGHRMVCGDLLDPSTRDPMSHAVMQKLTNATYIELVSKQIEFEATKQKWADYIPDGIFQLLDDHGTSHFSIIDKDLNGVAMTTTVNFILGSKFASESTGIVLNNEMNDFTVNLNATDGFGLPPSKANLIRPFKTPMSSMSPSIFLNKQTQKIRLAIGASGGPTIISSTAQVALNILTLLPKEKSQEVRKIINQFPRVHVQVGDTTTMEEGFSSTVVQGLNQKGHQFNTVKILPDGAAVGNVQAVLRLDKQDGSSVFYPGSDIRKLGEPDGY